MERREFLKVAAAGSVLVSAAARESDEAGPLFPAGLLSSQWTKFRAAGYSHPVTGVIYRRDTPATNGMPLGGVDTGCIDLETSGMWGYCTLFNSHVPRRGPINYPMVGLSVGGKTWVLCDPTAVKTYDTSDGFQPAESYPRQIFLSEVETAKEIHYFGHYPIADLEFETTAPVSTGLRAWSPFLPGDLDNSMLPGLIFEVRLRNTSGAEQRGTLAFTFPGPTGKESGGSRFQREPIHGPLEGVVVTSGSRWGTPLMAPRTSYVFGVIGDEKPRFGGGLDANGADWARIAESLPQVHDHNSAGSVAVDFVLGSGESRIVRFLVTWHSPRFKAAGLLSATEGNTFTHMYALRWRSARAAALILARRYEELLRRIVAWQEVIYGDDSLPPWLQDSLINNFHLITETGMWAAAEAPLPSWVRSEDGLFGMNECPRGCPQIECIPCSFYGNIPVVYFFPELALSTLRGYKGYQYPEGAPPWIFGGVTGGTPPIDFASPTRGYQVTLNGICYAAMVDRYALCWPNADFNREFYDSVKRATIYTVNLRPEYELGDRVISMPTGNEGTEWFEAPEPGWFGMVSHVGGLHLAQCRIAYKMAQQAGDGPWATECAAWIKAGMQSMETKMWMGTHYLTCWEPETGKRSDMVFGYP